MNELGKDVKESVAEFRKIKEEFRVKIKDQFFNTFKQLFEKNPTVNLVYWSQYTPYFNDGDPCRFNVQDDVNCVFIPDLDYDNLEKYFDGSELVDEELGDGFVDCFTDETLSCYSDCLTISDMVSSVEVLDFLERLGEGMVVVTKNGFEVFECEDHY